MNSRSSKWMADVLNELDAKQSGVAGGDDRFT
jgi:hypothetical protein